MTQFLPENLLALFAPRPPIEFKPPPDELLVNRKRAPMLGIAQYVGLFEVVSLCVLCTFYSNFFKDPVNTPLKPYVETKEEKRQRRVCSVGVF